MNPPRAALAALAALAVGLGGGACTATSTDAGPTPSPSSVLEPSPAPAPTPAPSEQPPDASGSPSPFPERPESGGGDDVADDAPSPSATSAGDGGGGSDGDGLPFPADTQEDTREAGTTPGAAVVTDLRIGRQDGFDRVVFELGGDEGVEPGWLVRYVDPSQAGAPGSGEPVDLPGEAVLAVYLRGLSYPFDTDAPPYDGPNPYEVASTELVTQVRFFGAFEGQAEAFVGLEREAPFRAYLLRDPVRVVVEVAGP